MESARETQTMTPIVVIDTDLIQDWASFHDVFAQAFGFPDFYGRNLDAWIDCMTFLDDPGAEMTTVHCVEGSVVTLELRNVDSFARRCPEQYAALVECAAFVNWRRIERGTGPVLAIAFHKTP
jgi:hypothetical protein